MNLSGTATLRAGIAVLAVAALCVAAHGTAYGAGTNVDSITFVREQNATSALLGMQNGTLDAHYLPVSLGDIDGLESHEGLRLYESHGGVRYSVLINPADAGFNPFEYREVRFALNHLIDKDYILNDLLDGNGQIMTSVFNAFHPDYDIVADADLQDASYDAARAERIISETLADNGASKNAQGKWQHEGQALTVKIFIRNDDAIRSALGERVASELEKVGFDVQRVYGDLIDAYVTVYSSDPKEYQWHIYTEAWGGSSAVKYDNTRQAAFYAPWYAGMPGFGIAGFWNYENPAIDSITMRLANEQYADGAERADLIRRAEQRGQHDAVRIFVASQNERYVASGNVTGVIPVQGDGITSRFSTINMDPHKDDLSIGVRHISQGAWNPIGLSDSYTLNIWDILRDPGLDTDPVTGDLIPVRTDWTVEADGGNEVGTIPDGAVWWNVTGQSWDAVADNTKYVSKVTYDFEFGNWHHGEPMDINDVMYTAYFAEQWGSSKPGDDTYDESYTSVAANTINHIYGFRVVDSDTIEVYMDYWHSDEDRIVSTGALWSSVPWEIYAAMELAVTNKTFSFSTADANRNIQWLSLVNSSHADVIREYVQEYRGNGTAPAGLYDDGVDYMQRYDAAIDWIDDRGHAMISNGPFYLESDYSIYDNRLTVASFDDGTYPFDADRWSYLQARTSPLPDTVRLGSIVPASGGATGYGQDILAAIGLAVWDWNARDNGLRMIVEQHDSQTNPAAGHDAFRSLYGSGARIYLGPSIDGILETVHGDIFGSNSLFVSCCSAVTTHTADDNVFRMVSNHTLHGNALAHLINRDGADVLVMIGRDNPWITDLMEQTRAEFVRIGNANPGDAILYGGSSYDGAIASLEARLNGTAAGCGSSCNVGILYVGFEESAGFLAAIYDGLYVPDGITVSLFGAEANTVTPRITGVEKAVLAAQRFGMESVQPIAYENDANLRVKSALLNGIGREPSVYAYSAYDSVMLLGDALIHANSTNIDVLGESMHRVGTDYEGALGTFSLNSAGDILDMKYGVWTLNDAWRNDRYYDGRLSQFVETGLMIHYNTADSPKSQGLRQANVVSYGAVEPPRPAPAPEPEQEPEPTPAPEPSRTVRSGGSGGGGNNFGSASTAERGTHTIRSVSWDCNEGMIRVVAGPYSEHLGVTVLTSELGRLKATTDGGEGYVTYTSPMSSTEDYIAVEMVYLSGRNLDVSSKTINVDECSNSIAYETVQEAPAVETPQSVESEQPVPKITEPEQEDVQEEHDKSEATEPAPEPAEPEISEADPYPVPTDVETVQDGMGQEAEPEITCGPNEELIDGLCVEASGGGCLIATAAYGSELAVQVQQLREIRDNTLLRTQAGASFMGIFNEAYYAVSPGVADVQRGNEVFNGMVRLAIAPGIASLGMMGGADPTEESVIVHGAASIMLLLGLYAGPVIAAWYATRRLLWRGRAMRAA